MFQVVNRDFAAGVIHFSPEQMREVAMRLQRMAEAGKVARLKPTTANLAAGALRAFAERPDYAELVAVICGSKDCPLRATCFGCRGKANMIMAIYEGDAELSRRMARER